MKLFIVHYHLRPGGVRRVIELAAPHLVQRLGVAITLVVGEEPDAGWLRAFRESVAPQAVEVFVDASLGYLDSWATDRDAELAVLEARVAQALRAGLVGEGLVWAHNLALGRNLFLARQLTEICGERELPLLSQHHDWWCDNRWARWTDARRCGFRSLRAVAAAILPDGPGIAHVAINSADAAILRRHFSRRAHWLPNPVEHADRNPDESAIHHATPSAPVWLMPCRILRRKNIAEALLLTRWLRPEARLVVTGGADEPDEQPYATALQAAAREHGWAVDFGAARSSASVAALFAECEAVVFTSIQEGFGLPALEAAAAGKPLLARRLPLVTPDLDTFGFRFPHSYDELLIDPSLFDWTAETERQRARWKAWRRLLPRTVRWRVGTPILLASPDTPRPVPFSRLTLPAQIEVLRQPLAQSWERCAPLNPALRDWQPLAEKGRLQITAWPPRADRWLCGSAYAENFVSILSSAIGDVPKEANGAAAQTEFIRSRLDSSQIYPLLWSPEV